jgi:hypothetical protein
VETAAPKCGEALVLRAGAAEPRQGMLIAGLVGLSAVAGFNGLLLAFGVVLAITHGGRGERRTFVSLGIGLAISLVAVRLWLRHWRRIRGLSAVARGWLVFACWLLPVVDVITLMLVLP